jgi:hypothetical protein
MDRGEGEMGMWMRVQGRRCIIGDVAGSSK